MIDRNLETLTPWCTFLHASSGLPLIDTIYQKSSVGFEFVERQM